MHTGRTERREWFEGWYFKQQNGVDTVAFIPAYHTDGAGETTASLQIITSDRVYQLDYPAQALRVERDPLRVTLGENTFSLEGCHIDCTVDDAAFRGDLRYHGRVPIASDIMGPFRFVPGMECRHSVFSLGHGVEGCLICDGREIGFEGGRGYIEGDRGTSFPSRYLWTQCSWEGNCVMVSVANIPFCGGHFTGCIGAVLYRGEQYRFATYRGVRLRRVSGREIELRQGGMTLHITLEEDCPQPLRAPSRGSMERTIHESAACRVRYRMSRGGSTLFDVTRPQAGFESVWEP